MVIIWRNNLAVHLRFKYSSFFKLYREPVLNFQIKLVYFCGTPFKSHDRIEIEAELHNDFWFRLENVKQAEKWDIRRKKAEIECMYI